MIDDRCLSPREYEITVQKITDVVNDSFRTRPMPFGVITERESKRRVQISREIWNVLYGELFWDAERVRDHLSPFLHRILDGGKLSDYTSRLKPLDRDGSIMWAPEKLHEIEPERRLSALAGNEPLIILPGSGGKK